VVVGAAAVGHGALSFRLVKTISYRDVESVDLLYALLRLRSTGVATRFGPEFGRPLRWMSAFDLGESCGKPV
jgi:hypothetical protein